MFQTEPHHFLQSFDHPVVFWVMNSVTQLGYDDAYILALIILFFGVSMKRSFVVMHMLLWTTLFTSLLKDFFALPRPENVDSTLKSLINEFTAKSPFIRKGGESFFGLPAREAIDYFRQHRVDTFGFPSGHVSGATAFWGGLGLFLNSGWVRISAVIIIVLMPFSRMFLGRHFLADVLGGLLLGAAAVFLAWYILLKRGKMTDFEAAKKFKPNVKLSTVLFLLAAIGIPLAFALYGNVVAAQFLGLNIGFLLVGLKGFPADDAKWFIRALRAVLAIAVFVGSSILLDQLIQRVGLGESEGVHVAKRGVETFLLIWGGTEIARKLKWFKNN